MQSNRSGPRVRLRARYEADEPRALYLPPIVVTALPNHARGLARPGPVFRFHHGGHLPDMLKDACKAAGAVLPRRLAFPTCSGTITERGCVSIAGSTA